MGGVKLGPYAWGSEDRKIIENRRRSELANMALDYLRLEEALGRPPTLKDVGRSGFEYRAEEAGLGQVVEEAWVRYERVVREALAGRVPVRQAQRVEEGPTPEQPRKPIPEVNLQSGASAGEPSGGRLSRSGAAAPSGTHATPKKSWWSRLLDR